MQGSIGYVAFLKSGDHILSGTKKKIVPLQRPSLDTPSWCALFITFCLLYRYDDKCDVWSIGCILWDMANKSNCFVHVNAHLI